MNQLLAVAAGGALGALLRYGMSLGVHGIFGRGFPYGTLTVNVSGSLAMLPELPDDLRDDQGGE